MSGSYDASIVYNSQTLEKEYSAAFPKDRPWVFETDEEQKYFKTEGEACSEQRTHRIKNGFAPISGEK